MNLIKKSLNLMLSAGMLFSVANAQAVLNMVGSTTVLPIAQLAAEVYMEKNDSLKISVGGGGSGVGVAAIMNGRTDIGMASRPAQTKEIVTAKANGINLFENAVAVDAITIVVHPEVGALVKNLTIAQIRDIYTGKISSWAEVGGPKKPIVVVSRDVSSGTFEVFKEKVLGGGKVKNDALMLASNKAVATAVGTTPFSIGYVGLAFLSPEIAAVTVDSVESNEENARSGKYKISRKLYMYTNGKPKGKIKDFLDFLLSAEGQALVVKTGYIAVK
ncbi:MAG TPA: phosphate ABC transporter substrate-binding protein [Spirochaetia bacterium]|nr:phosphate ABC transporter substrate-binding protein [Spirochaetia bacterium]